MSFPFGGFKTPRERRKGRYSGATRDFLAEMRFDEGDPDPVQKNLNMLEDPEARVRFEACWQDKICVQQAEFEVLGLKLWALGQSHIDLAWLWRLYQGVNKCRITLRKAVLHAEHLPDFSFTLSQPVMLDWLRQESPDLFELIKQAVATGQFELQGGSWVEADQKVPCGESFCRSRLYGQRFYLEHFGKLATVEWLTDSFGFNNQIPQFVSKSGGNSFFTIKIAGNWPPDQFPFWNFLWRSPDGSEVLTHVTNFQFRPLTRWSLFRSTRRILKPGASLVCDYSHPDPGNASELGSIWPEILIIYGIGDGGHGPTSEEVHRMRYFIEKGYVEGFTTARAFFDRIGEVRDRLPIWNAAELFYNLHRGTLTTQALVKRMNRKFEWSLMGLESLYAWATFLLGAKFGLHEHETFHNLWKDVLLLQFHDILPGSSIPEVYDDCYDIWEVIQAELSRLEFNLFNRMLTHFNPHEPTGFPPASVPAILMVNPTNYGGLFPIETPISLETIGHIQQRFDHKNSVQIIPPDECGERFLDQTGSRLLMVTRMNPWSYEWIPFDTGSNEEHSLHLEETTDTICLETTETRLTISKETGAILSYFDLLLNREVLGGPSGVLAAFRDWAFNERAWNLGPGYRECPLEPDEISFVSIRVIERGPVRASVEVIYEITESGSRLVQYIQVYPNIRGVFFDLAFDWKQTDTLLKHEFSLSFTPQVAVAEGPYTTEIYTADPDQRAPLDSQRWEGCAHTWLAFPAPEGSWGVAYVDDSKYGFDIDKSRFGVTMVRGPDYPVPTANSYAALERDARKKANDKSIPTHTDQGFHRVKAALIPYEGLYHTASIPQFAHVFNNPPRTRVVETLPQLRNLEGGIFSLTTEAPNLELVCMKLPEERTENEKALILRVVETGRSKTTAAIQWPESLGIIEVQAIDLLERPIDDPALKIIKGDRYITGFSSRWAPHAIQTYWIQRE